jgi:dTDP-4-dehydrorhamnose reductase
VASEGARRLGIEPRLVPITVDQLPRKVPRPRYCALSTRKLAATGFAMPPFGDALRRWLQSRRGLE